MAPFLLALALHIVALTGSGAVSLEAVVDIGCFSTKFANSNPYYKLTQGLPWEKGVAVCDERLTKYVGVQAEPGWAGDNFIFCGNDLDHSVRVNSSECSPCIEDATRQCGGQDTMSLYKLRDKTPFAVLLGRNNGYVEIFIEGQERTDSKISSRGVVESIDYLYSTDDIIFQDSNTHIYRSSFNYLNSTFNTPQEIVKFDNNEYDGEIFLEIVLNWLKKTLYRCSRKRCIKSDLHGATIGTVTLERRSALRDLKIDPQTNSMFFIEEPGKLFSRESDHFSYTPKEFSNYGSIHVYNVSHLAVDIQEQFVYVIGHVSGQIDSYLVKVDYEDKWAKVIFSGPELRDAQSLDVYHEEAVWINADRNKLYRCTLSPTCKPEQLTVFYEPSQYLINDVKIYHPERQTPGKKNLCKELKCSHSCAKESLFAVKCSCPLGMELLHNTRCTEIQQDTYPGVNLPAQKTGLTTKYSGATKSNPSLQGIDERTTTTKIGFFLVLQTITSFIIIAILLSIVYFMIKFQTNGRNMRLFRHSGSYENDDL